MFEIRALPVSRATPCLGDCLPHLLSLYYIVLVDIHTNNLDHGCLRGGLGAVIRFVQL